MAQTEQMSALTKTQEQYGKTGFTENHENYRRVGFKMGPKVISAIGSTWGEALFNLARRVRNVS